MKEYFLNLMQPCCGLSYQEMRDFINAVDFTIEENRDKVLEGVTRKGSLTQEAWMIFIGSIELNDTINLELLQEWSGQDCKLSCEQWQQVIGGVYFKTNFHVIIDTSYFYNYKDAQGNSYNIMLDNAQNLKLWLEGGYDVMIGQQQNDCTNVVITDFRIVGVDGNKTEIKCNVDADGTKLFFMRFPNVFKVGNVRGLQSLWFSAIQSQTFDLKQDLPYLQRIVIISSPMLKGFDTKINLQNLQDITINNCGLIDFNPSIDFPNIISLSFGGNNDFHKFNPTSKFPRLQYLHFSYQTMTDFTATNWIWFTPMGDTNHIITFDNCPNSTFIGSPAHQLFVSRNWQIIA